ncbi:hypothetical protein T4C_13294 [Trichinella pseudospiralis]|uniref:Uncharacterized protein n=1 Tax=Trichinella pseudospiralis TaxID=6337 RepID=A0A0V1J7P7_TRIPS|nr:hypothetical protein T4D_12649 [Trichinella pseudospiralis]KRZ30974.1 hypothetical protein T4C_13294 [Trichinella pseudospiralis]
MAVAFLPTRLVAKSQVMIDTNQYVDFQRPLFQPNCRQISVCLCAAPQATLAVRDSSTDTRNSQRFDAASQRRLICVAVGSQSEFHPS